MQAIELVWKRFFEQFVPFVYNEGELIKDPENIMYPRITYSYQVGDFFSDILTVFQVWSWSHNNNELLSVCNQIAKAIPVASGASISIRDDTRYEYFDPATLDWIPFDIAEMQDIAERLSPDEVDWREVEGQTAGAIEIWRGSPFLTPSPKDEVMSRCMYGTLACRYLNTL